MDKVPGRLPVPCRGFLKVQTDLGYRINFYSRFSVFPNCFISWFKFSASFVISVLFNLTILTISRF